jgi:hypothetical protein
VVSRTRRPCSPESLTERAVALLVAGEVAREAPDFIPAARGEVVVGRSKAPSTEAFGPPFEAEGSCLGLGSAGWGRRHGNGREA